MRRAFMALVVMAVAFLALTGCEPKMTIEAHAVAQADGGPAGRCGEVLSLTGRVTPAGATPRVVLQQTSSGKWVDIKWYGSQDEHEAHRLTAPVKGGGFTVTYLVKDYKVKHFRVRSDGGGSASNSFYVSVLGGSSGSCP